MNDIAAEALVRASLRGTRQIVGKLTDTSGDGRCALGVISEALYGHPEAAYEQPDFYARAGFSVQAMRCPECEAMRLNEATIVAHLNDAHGWSFLDIARKLV